MPVDSITKLSKRPSWASLVTSSQEVFSERATNTAVAHFNQLFLATIKRNLVLHNCRIDIDFAHIVDNNSHLFILPVVQNVA